jgi:hypothetical protein
MAQRFSLQPSRYCLAALFCASSGLTVSTIDLFHVSLA